MPAGQDARGWSVGGPAGSEGVAREAARDLTGIVGELAALKADASQWLAGPGRLGEYRPEWSELYKMLYPNFGEFTPHALLG